ncbi:MAG: hypothetical protein WDO19_24480 [Bacteroidota bacterium]
MDTSTIWLILVLAIVPAIIINYLLIQWMFHFTRRLWNEKQQIILLTMIAEKLGVSKEDLQRIKDKLEVSDSYLDKEFGK